MIEPRLLKLIEGIFRLTFVFGLFLSVVVLIYLGIIYITKSEEGAKEVHEKLPLFVVGLIIIFLSLTIPKIVELFFK